MLADQAQHRVGQDSEVRLESASIGSRVRAVHDQVHEPAECHRRVRRLRKRLLDRTPCGRAPYEDWRGRIWAEVPYTPTSGRPTIGYMTGVSATAWEPVRRDVCMDLLRTAPYGRVALTASAMPSVVPVAIEVSGEHVALRSLVGPHVLVHPCQVVALEADCLADDAGKRWSVVVVGMLVVEQTEAEPDRSCPSPRFLLNTEFVSGWCSSPPSSLGSPSLDTEQEVPTRVL